MPHAVGLATVGLINSVSDPCIEIAIAVDIAQRDSNTRRTPQCLTTVGEIAKAVIFSDVVTRTVCHPCIEITITVEISQCYGAACG